MSNKQGPETCHPNVVTPEGDGESAGMVHMRVPVSPEIKGTFRVTEQPTGTVTGKEPSEKNEQCRSGDPEHEKSCFVRAPFRQEKGDTVRVRHAFAGPSSHLIIPGHKPGPRMGALTNSVGSLRGGIQAVERLKTTSYNMKTTNLPTTSRPHL